MSRVSVISLLIFGGCCTRIWLGWILLLCNSTSNVCTRPGFRYYMKIKQKLLQTYKNIVSQPQKHLQIQRNSVRTRNYFYLMSKTDI